MGWKIGTDWSAKKDAAGSQAQPYEDRPYRAKDLTPVSESDVTTNPANKVDET